MNAEVAEADVRAVDCDVADCLWVREDGESFGVVVGDIVAGYDDDGDLASDVWAGAFDTAEHAL